MFILWVYIYTEQAWKICHRGGVARSYWKIIAGPLKSPPLPGIFFKPALCWYTLRVTYDHTSNHMTCLRCIENVYFTRKQQHIFFVNLVCNKNLLSVRLINTSDEINSCEIPFVSFKQVPWGRCEPVRSGLLSTCCKLVNIKPQWSVHIRSKQACWFHRTCRKLLTSSLLPLVFNSIVASCAHQLAAGPQSSSCDRQVASGLSRLDIFIRADAACHQLALAR